MARRRLARGFTAAERGNRERARGSHRDRLGNKGATEAAPLILASAANRYPLRRLRSGTRSSGLAIVELLWIISLASGECWRVARREAMA